MGPQHDTSPQKTQISNENENRMGYRLGMVTGKAYSTGGLYQVLGFTNICHTNKTSSSCLCEIIPPPLPESSVDNLYILTCQKEYFPSDCFQMCTENVS